MHILRDPSEETEDYPGLVVCDGRVTGSITAGRSRLPLWAFVSTLPASGWDEAEDYDPEEYGWTAEKMADFLYDLLEARGEFGRLLLAIANAERVDRERSDAAVKAHFATHHPVDRFCECGFPDPPPWWRDPELYAPVAEQLRRCLKSLEPTP